MGNQESQHRQQGNHGPNGTPPPTGGLRRSSRIARQRAGADQIGESTTSSRTTMNDLDDSTSPPPLPPRNTTIPQNMASTTDSGSGITNLSTNSSTIMSDMTSSLTMTENTNTPQGSTSDSRGITNTFSGTIPYNGTEIPTHMLSQTLSQQAAPTTSNPPPSQLSTPSQYQHSRSSRLGSGKESYSEDVDLTSEHPDHFPRPCCIEVSTGPKEAYRHVIEEYWPQPISESSLVDGT